MSPDKQSDQRFQAWAEAAMVPSHRVPRTGEQLRCVAMPLGGIGTGHVALAGDGGLRQWQIFNNANHQAHVPHTFFAVRAQVGGEPPVCRVLQSPALYDDGDFEPAPCVSDHMVPVASRELLQQLPGVAEVDYVGEYPVAHLTYHDSALPVQVRLEALSPMIPLDPESSSIPAAVFTFHIANRGEKPVAVSVAMTLQNAVGYDGLGEISGTAFPGYGGNVNRVVRLRGLTAVDLGNATLPRDDPAWGQMVLAVCDAGASALAEWDDVAALWADLEADGRFGPGPEGRPSAPGRTWNGALAATATLAPGEHHEVAFILAWYFPNRYANWSQEYLGIPSDQSRLWVGNHYAGRFGGALDVATQMCERWSELVEPTRLFQSTFCDSTLPYWLLRGVGAQMATLRSPTCFWAADGSFYGFEGCCGASTGSAGGSSGCCPLNCTHVWNYEMTVAKLYPQLERTMRLLDLEVQMNLAGGIPHRTVLPLYLKRWEDRGPGSEVIACDGHYGTVLKTYREYLVCGDRAFLDRAWPGVKRAMEFGFARWDPDRDGVLEGPQWNTFDLHFYGHNTFCGSLYLAALRAAWEMARIEGEGKLAEEYLAAFESGRERGVAELWNGDYFIQRYDEEAHPERQYGQGCLSDQLLGQWWAHLLGLGYLYPEEHVRTALQSIYWHNFRQDLHGSTQQPRVFASEDEMGLLNATWPYGGRPEVPMLYCDEIWTGTEYQVAGAMLMEGMVEEAYHLVKAARDRYDGTRRNPWNEVECGDHYVRPMSNWALLEAASGFFLNAARGLIRFAPRVTPESFKCFFVAGTAWGSFVQQTGAGHHTVRLRPAWGELRFLTLELGLPPGVEASTLTTNLDHANPARLSIRSQYVALEFEREVVLKAGEVLEATLA